MQSARSIASRPKVKHGGQGRHEMESVTVAARNGQRLDEEAPVVDSSSGLPKRYVPLRCLTSMNAEQIRLLRGVSSDFEETEAIKQLLATRYQSQQLQYLTKTDFDRIARWKLGQQLGRVRHLLEQNSPELIADTTRLGLSALLPDERFDCDFRFGVLTSLRGVGIGLASAILALSFPHQYCVIDYRGWRQLLREDRRVFTVGDYFRYLQAVQGLARELSWPVQEVDLAIWEYDKRTHANHRRRNVT